MELERNPITAEGMARLTGGDPIYAREVYHDVETAVLFNELPGQDAIDDLTDNSSISISRNERPNLRMSPATQSLEENINTLRDRDPGFYERIYIRVQQDIRQLEAERVESQRFEEERMIPDWFFENSRPIIVNPNMRNRYLEAEMLPRTTFNFYMGSGSNGVSSAGVNATGPLMYGSCRCGMCGIKTFKFDKTEEKEIEQGRNIECPVSYEEIGNGDTYAQCSTCKYNFTEKAILAHFANKITYNCPMCRSEWTNTTKYINKREFKMITKVDTDTVLTNLWGGKNSPIRKYIVDSKQKTIYEQWFGKNYNTLLNLTASTYKLKRPVYDKRLKASVNKEILLPTVTDKLKFKRRDKVSRYNKRWYYGK